MHALAQKRGSEESDGSGLLLVAAEMLRFQKIASLAAKGVVCGHMDSGCPQTVESALETRGRDDPSVL